MLFEVQRTQFVRAILAVAFVVIAGNGVTFAAPINHGDFAGATVMFQQVTEDTNTGDAQPLFGAPSVIGNFLDFDPSGFSASASGGSVDSTDGQLNFTLMSTLGNAISELAVAEGGDFTLAGSGTAATQVGYGLVLSTVKILEVDNAVLATPITLTAQSTAGTNNLISDPGITQPWALSLTYDIHAGLVASGTPYLLGATKVEVAIDDTLVAVSELASVALVAKKDFVLIGATTYGGTVTVPEPSAAALLAVLSSGGILARRRRA